MGSSLVHRIKQSINFVWLMMNPFINRFVPSSAHRINLPLDLFAFRCVILTKHNLQTGSSCNNQQLMYIKSKMGRRAEPCGAPKTLSYNFLTNLSFITINHFLLLRNQNSLSLLTPRCGTFVIVSFGTHIEMLLTS